MRRPRMTRRRIDRLVAALVVAESVVLADRKERRCIAESIVWARQLREWHAAKTGTGAGTKPETSTPPTAGIPAGDQS